MNAAIGGLSLQGLLLGSLPLGFSDAAALFLHFAALSLLAVGGAITTAPDMQRYLVSDQGWLSDAQFTASVALAQAAPGPNVLFIAVLGFNVGGLAGVAATLAGTLLPSSALTLAFGRFSRRNHEARLLRAFTAGLAPLTIGLLLSTSWVLLQPALQGAWQPALLLRQHPANTVALVALTLLVMLRTKASPLWLIAAGAAAGMLGWV